ncbi:hypothetical protein GGI12_003413, partial [Dipsacomyces acuminosporus]
RKIIVADDKPFDPESIPQRKWMEYEHELAAAGVLNAPPPNMNPNAGSSQKEEERLSMYSSQSGANMSRAASGIGFQNMQMGAHSLYGAPAVPHSSPGSVIMAANGDPRLSTAMINPQMLAAQTMGGASNNGSPYNSMAFPQAPTPQPPQHSYMGAGAWVPPTTLSMYGSEAPGMRPVSYMSASGAAPGAVVQTPSVYIPQQDFGSAPASGRSTPVNFAAAPQLAGAVLPTDDQIVDAIRRILVGADLTTTTKKRIRMQLAQEFGVDLTPKKDFISSVVDQMLIGGV